MASRQPRAVRTPFENTTTSSGATTNTYGYQSQDRNNPYVQDYLNTPIDVDPGVGRRGDLAEQQMEHGWDGGFASGIPQQVRMQNVDAGRRALRSETAAQAQQAEYARNALQLQRAASLLPQLVNTGGTQTGNQFSSGFGSQVATPQPGLLSEFLGGARQAAGAFI